MPKGGTSQAKKDPSHFITRNSTKTLEFEGVAQDGSKIQMIPLKEVMLEKYVAYFMTAGTKPPQPRVGYCPHSVGEDYPYVKPPMDMDPAVSADPPAPPRGPKTERNEHPTIHSVNRGVSWSIVDGKIAHSPLPQRQEV